MRGRARAVRPWRLARITVAGSLAATGLLFVTAQAAGASWLEMNTPIMAGTISEFTAVSCTSPSICMAVGDSTSGTSQLLSENRTKSGWAIQSVPQPAPGSALLGVWCTFSFSCEAVGDAPHGSNGSVPLAEHWNGNKWRIEPTQTRKGAATSHLNAVTCASALDCVAVGFSSNSLNNQVPLIEHWNGTSWKIEKAPTRSGFTESQLTGVSCTSATRCIAVGSSFKPSVSVTLAEIWNGSKWTIQSTPNAKNAGGFGAIHCVTRVQCFAVGDGLGANWNGTKWSLVKLGFPGDPADLTAISCTKANACYAAGGFFQEAVLTGVLEFWNGSRWRVQNYEITSSNDSSVFNGISCTTATNCTAVGSFDDSGNHALAEDFSLRWQSVIPLPFNGAIATVLSSVSCVSPNSCIAVGSVSTSSDTESFADAWDGTQWNSANMPKQSSTSFNGVSCKTSTFCIAVGELAKKGGNVTIAERWNGVKWVIQATPNPAGAASNFLTGISCPATNACTAVGFYVTAHGGLALLAEQWNGKSWGIKHTPAPPKNSNFEFNAVSCASAKSCEAVARSTKGPFAEKWDGKNWTVQATPLAKGDKDGFLAGVSCLRASACLAVGDDLHSGRLVPIDEHWNGKTWKPQQAAVPGGGGQSGLSSVSCVAGGGCEAMGFVSRSTTNSIAEFWNGRTWSMQGVDRPSGSQETFLPSLSCNSRSACMAVGSYLDASSMEQILTEQFS